MPSTLSSKMLLLKALLSVGSTDLGRVNVESGKGKRGSYVGPLLGGLEGGTVTTQKSRVELTLGKDLQGSFLIWTECVWSQIHV